MFLFCSIYKTGTALLLQPWRLSFPCPSRRLGHGTNFKMHAGLVLQRADDAKQVEAIAIVADAEYGRGRRVGLAFRGGRCRSIEVAAGAVALLAALVSGDDWPG